MKVFTERILCCSPAVLGCDSVPASDAACFPHSTSVGTALTHLPGGSPSTYYTVKNHDGDFSGPRPMGSASHKSHELGVGLGPFLTGCPLNFQTWASGNAGKICYFLNQFIPSINLVNLLL